MKTKERLDKILQSAKAEFLTQGFANTNMRTIAKNANLSTGSLYNRFADKEALFSHIVEPYATEFIEIYQKGNDEGENAYKEHDATDNMNAIALKVI